MEIRMTYVSDLKKVTLPPSKKVTIKDTTLLIIKNFSNLSNIIPREYKEWFEQFGRRVKPLTLKPLLLLDYFLITWYNKRVKELPRWTEASSVLVMALYGTILS